MSITDWVQLCLEIELNMTFIFSLDIFVTKNG